MVHIRYNGQSLDLHEHDAEIVAGMDDAAIKRAVAQRLDIGEDRLRSYVVDHIANGNIVVRPEAVYG